MRKNLLVAAMLVSAVGAFGQGAIKFDNRATTAGTDGNAPVVAPIFGVDPACPSCEKQGNPSYGSYTNRYSTSAPQPQPAGTQVYGGAALAGTGFTATLWANNSNLPDDQLQLISTTAFRTQTTLSLQGYVVAPTTAPIVPNTPNTSDRAKFQVRVWDNVALTAITGKAVGQQTWADVLANAATVPHGTSPIITVPFQLGAGSIGPPNLVGLESFQLFVVPEPSVIALGVLGAGCLFLLRRRK